jgi:uncharacterized protein
VKHPRLAPWVVVACTLAFGAALAARELVNPWLSNAAVAAATLGLSGFILGRRLSALLTPRLWGTIAAIALGALLVVLTHAGYLVMAGLFPAFEDAVAALYLDIEDSPPGWITALLIVVVVGAEELLWRGVAVELLVRRVSRAYTLAIAPALYAVPQVIGGSWLLLATALALGLVFTAQRLHTGRLIDPLLTHAIWSVSVFYAVPLV